MCFDWPGPMQQHAHVKCQEICPGVINKMLSVYKVQLKNKAEYKQHTKIYILKMSISTSNATV